MATDSDKKQAADAITAAQDDLAREIARSRYDALQPLFENFGVEPGKLEEYTHYELSYLANAIAEDKPGLFAEYIDWTKSMLSSNEISLDVLKKNIDIVHSTLLKALPASTHAVISRYMRVGDVEIAGSVAQPCSFIDPRAPHADSAGKYLDAVLAGDRGRATKLVMERFQAGVGVEDIYLHILQPAQYEIGRLWQTNQITVAQEHFCSAVTQLIMSQLYYPHICGGEKKEGTMVALCVSGELHEIGMRMVSDFFEMHGWNVCYLGANMPAYNIVDTLITNKASVLAVSASMASSVNRAHEVIDKVRSSKASGTRIIVGGYGFNRDPGLWKLVGADAYAGSAREALEIVQSGAGA